MGYLRGYFIGELAFRCPPEDDSTMELTAELKFIDSRGRTWRAPAGMETDGASVGQLLALPVVGPLTHFVLGGDQFTGPFRPAAVMHDAAYARASTRTLWEAFRSPARALADRLIREAAMAREVVVIKHGRPLTIIGSVVGGGVAPSASWLDRYEVRDRRPASWWRAWTVWAALRLFGAPAWQSDASRAARSLAHLPELSRC